MKKFLIISIFLFLLVVTPKVKASEDYNTFQEIEISRGKMLADYTTSEYNNNNNKPHSQIQKAS